MKKEYVFPIIVLVLSILSLLELTSSTINYFSIINSLFGITGVILFYLKKKPYEVFMNLWIYLQFIIITKTSMQTLVEVPILDFSQFFRIKLGFFLSTDESTYRLSFNFLPLIYLVAFKVLQVKSLVGHTFQIKLYRQNELLENALPQEVEVLQVVHFPQNKNWLLISLNNAISIEGINYQYGLIKPKDQEVLKPGQTGQMAHLRLIEDNYDINNLILNLDDYPFIDWVFVK